MDQYNKAFEEALARNTEDTKRWENYSEDLKQTAISLKEFIKSVDVSIMVPLGKKGLIRGKLIHTNEVFVSHGSSIFTECSQLEAMGIIQHRLKLSSERLKALNTERELFRGKLDLPVTENLFAMNDPNCQEIIEDYVEENEQQWRKKHRESVKKQKLEESQKWKEVTSSKEKSHEDVIKLLEDLELMEELDDELDKLEIHDDETLKKLMSREPVSDSKKKICFAETPSTNNDSIETQIEPPSIISNSHEIVSLLQGYRNRIEDILKNVEKNDELLDLFLDLSNIKEELDDDIDQLNPGYDEQTESDDEPTSDNEAPSLQSSETKSPKAEKNVKFSEDFDIRIIENKCQNSVENTEEQKTLYINFKHSKNVFKPDIETQCEIVGHPADIYKKFPHCFNVSTTKKSILKRTNSSGEENAVNFDKGTKQQVEITPIIKVYQGDVLGEIVERKDPQLRLEDNIVHIEPKAEVKRISKFKQMRQNS